MNTVAIVTGATRNLGFALAMGLAKRLQPGDVVYLTGRDANRVTESLRQISGAIADVRGEALDVSDRRAVQAFAAMVEKQHGGVDIVLSNHYARVQPEDDPAEVVSYY